MNKVWKKSAALALAGVMTAGMLSGCGASTKKLDGTKTVATVNGENIQLGLLSFVVRNQQAYLKAMYEAYGLTQYTANLWDSPASEGSEQTYGEVTRDESLEQLSMMYVICQHAAEYGVELSEEDQTKIKEAAAAFIAANSEETIERLAVNEEQMAKYLELQTIATRMHDPIIADVDREVSDEQAQMSSFSYVHISVTPDSTEEEIATAEANAAAVQEAMAAAFAPAEEPEEAEEVEEEKAATAAKKDEAEEEDAEEAEAEAEEDAEAEAVEAPEKEETPAEENEVDINAIVKEIDDSLYMAKGTFQTNLSDEWEDTTSTYLNAELVAAVRELKEGEVSDVIKTEDSGYYVAYLNKEFDEEATESQRKSVITTRENDAYTEITQGWMDAAEVTIDRDVLLTLLVTDAQVFTIQSTPADTTVEPEDDTIVDEVEDLTEEDEDLQPIEEPAEEDETVKD